MCAAYKVWWCRWCIHQNTNLVLTIIPKPIVPNIFRRLFFFWLFPSARASNYLCHQSKSVGCVSLFLSSCIYAEKRNVGFRTGRCCVLATFTAFRQGSLLLAAKEGGHYRYTCQPIPNQWLDTFRWLTTISGVTVKTELDCIHWLDNISITRWLNVVGCHHWWEEKPVCCSEIDDEHISVCTAGMSGTPPAKGKKEKMGLASGFRPDSTKSFSSSFLLPRRVVCWSSCCWNVLVESPEPRNYVKVSATDGKRDDPTGSSSRLCLNEKEKVRWEKRRQKRGNTNSSKRWTS